MNSSTITPNVVGSTQARRPASVLALLFTNEANDEILHAILHRHTHG